MKMRSARVLSHATVIVWFALVTRVISQTSQNRLSKNIVPSIYELHITVDLDNLRFSGNETIYVRVHQPTSTIELHLLDLSVDNVQVIEGENGVDIASQIYDSVMQVYRITMSQTLVAGHDYEISMNFEGEIKDDMKGLYRSSYYENRVVKYMATTFSAAAYARKIFPCFDEPNFKAEFKLAITNRDNYSTLANTRSINVERNNETGVIWKTTTFAPTPVMSTYLLAFAVSEFRNITELEPSEFSVYSSATTINSMRYALDTGKAAIEALEDYIGHSYQLDKMDFIAIDDFLMGAMENWGFVSFKSSLIMSGATGGLRANRRKLQEITNIISHELVHMFFGNQVTCEYWDFVWLNEGFASYLEYVITDKIRPGWRILDYFNVNRMQTVMTRDVAPKTHPMTRPYNTPDEITKVYDFVVYPKAASVIRMIEHIMSPAMFQLALHVFIQERSYQSATDEQLYEVLERVRRGFPSNVLYPPIPEIFKSWANNAGYPILNVNVGATEVTVSQELFVPHLDKNQSSEFDILYNYATSSTAAEDFTSTSPSHWIRSSAETKESINLGSNRWAIFNVQQTGYYRVNYDKSNWKAIIDELNGNNFAIIHELNRAQLLDDSFNLARYGYLDFDTTLNLLKYLRQETSLASLIAGLKSIDFLLMNLDQQSFFKDLRNILLKIVDDIYIKINDDSVAILPDDADYQVLKKLHVNSFACKIGVQTCTTDATKKLALFDHEFKEVDVDERPYLYCGILGGDLAAFNYAELRKKIIASNGNEELYRQKQEEFNEIFHAFSACDLHFGRIETFLNNIFNFDPETVGYQNVSKDNAVQVIGNLIKTSSEHRSLMMKFYSENFDAVNATVPFRETLSMFAEAINTQEHLERFKTLATTGGLTADEISESILAMEENIRWISAKALEIADWVKKNAGTQTKLSILSILVSIFVIVLQ